jgi:hypothetical protein
LLSVSNVVCPGIDYGIFERARGTAEEYEKHIDFSLPFGLDRPRFTIADVLKCKIVIIYYFETAL